MASKDFLRGLLGALKATEVGMETYGKRKEFAARLAEKRLEQSAALEEKRRESEVRAKDQDYDFISKTGISKSMYDLGTGPERQDAEYLAAKKGVQGFQERLSQRAAGRSGAMPDDLSEIVGAMRDLDQKEAKLGELSEPEYNLREQLRSEFARVRSGRGGGMKYEAQPYSKPVSPKPGFWKGLFGGGAPEAQGFDINAIRAEKARRAAARGGNARP